MVGKFIKQCLQHLLRLCAVLAKNTAFLHTTRPLAPRERILIKSKMGDKIECIEVTTVRNKVLQGIEQNAAFCKLVENDLLSLGGVPPTQELRQRPELHL